MSSSSPNLSGSRITAKQFLIAVLPTALVLFAQTAADGWRLNTIAHSRPIQTLAQQARSDYRTFTSGVGDAVDAGSLGGSAVDALHAADRDIQQLVAAGADPAVMKDAQSTLRGLTTQLTAGASLQVLLSQRAAIQAGDALTKQIADEFAKRDAAIVHAAIAASHGQQLAVLLSMLFTFAITYRYVLSSQRGWQARLKRDEQAAEESLRLKNGLDNCSIGLMVIDPSGGIAYANAAVAKDLSIALPDLLNKRDGRLVGATLESVVGSATAEVLAGGRHELTLGGRTLRLSSDRVRSVDGHNAGTVIELRDQTEQIALERQVAEIVEAAARGEFNRRIHTQELGASDGFYGPLAQGINRLMATSEEGLEELARMLELLSSGDLTGRIERDFGGTFGKLKDYTNRMADTLESTVGQIKSVSEVLDGAAGRIASVNAELSDRTAEQSAGVQTTVQSMTTMTALVRGNGERAHEADRLAAEATRVAREGGEAMNQVIRTMNDIAGASQRMSDIVGVIDELAFQTNILALNAAVEAARAGEHGRAFAVVAAEVRSLAARSADAAREIHTLIGTSVKTIEDGAKLVSTAGESMSGIVAASGRVTAIVREIAEASANQTDSVENVDRSIVQIDAATRQNMQQVQEAASAARSLEQQATLLVDSVRVFRLNDNRELIERSAA